MSKKKKRIQVFYDEPLPDEREEDTLPPEEQQLRVWIDTKGRGGKTVTLIREFEGTSYDMEELAKGLKQQCGTGGSVKEGEIIIQGDHRDRIVSYLKKKGYSRTKKAGG